MRPVDPRVVELLNDALTLELSVVNTYFLHARMLDNWGFPKLGKVFYDLSIDEMRDADDLINRILMFDGHPNVQRLNANGVPQWAANGVALCTALGDQTDPNLISDGQGGAIVTRLDGG